VEGDEIEEFRREIHDGQGQRFGLAVRWEANADRLVVRMDHDARGWFSWEDDKVKAGNDQQTIQFVSVTLSSTAKHTCLACFRSDYEEPACEIPPPIPDCGSRPKSVDVMPSRDDFSSMTTVQSWLSGPTAAAKKTDFKSLRRTSGKTPRPDRPRHGRLVFQFDARFLRYDGQTVR
jgi:hypothetical protein